MIQKNQPTRNPNGAIEIGVLALVLALLPGAAQAYIDPGSGALLVQAVLSGIFGAIFLARRALRRLASRLFGGESQDPPPNDPRDSSSNDGAAGR